MEAAIETVVLEATSHTEVLRPVAAITDLLVVEARVLEVAEAEALEAHQADHLQVGAEAAVEVDNKPKNIQEQVLI